MRDERNVIGIDIGSRTTEIVWLNGDGIADSVVFDTGHSPLRQLMELVDGVDPGRAVATGYGRHLAAKSLGCRTVTEILACARAVPELHQGAGIAVDIGGQDSKAIELSPGGGFGRFEMNDRCAAGTGRFLEVMARVLGYRVEEIGEEALHADSPAKINSMCTVFAESEVVSLIARGDDRRRIALGLHLSAARRVASMVSRLRPAPKAVFVGGVANNPCMGKLLEEELACEIVTPARPELTCAFGAALVAADGVGGRHGPL